MKIEVSNMPFMESVSIGIFIGAGGRYERRELCGMSHVVEHLLFKGTETRTAMQLKEEIEGVGGSFNAMTGEEYTCYLVRLPAKHMDIGLEILSDMVLHPKFDPVEIEKEKNVILEEIKMYKDQPAQYVQEILAEVMWPEHPLGRPLTGYEKTVRSFDRKKIAGFKRAFYHPRNIAVVAAGRMKERKLSAMVKRLYSGQKDKKKNGFRRFRNRQPGPRIKVLAKGTEQTQIAIGFHSFRKNHPDKYARSLLNVILGGSMSSRLFEELREIRGLCYDVGTSAKGYHDTGAFLVHAGVDNKKLHEALGAVMGELIKIKEKPAGKSEFERSKEFLKGQLSLLLEDTASRMLWLGDKVIYHEKVPKLHDILSEIDRVRPEDITRLAKETFTKKSLNLACIGPVNKKSEDRMKGIINTL